MINRIRELLGDNAHLLEHECKTISADRIHLPGPDFIDRVMADTDRSPTVLRNMQHMFDHGRLGGTGYVSILPVDQGIEHTAGSSFAPNPDYYDPANICELALAGGCNAVATTYGALGSIARKYAHKIPMMLKINHNELLSYPNQYDQVMFGSIEQAFEMGCTSIGATVYWGSEGSRRQLQEISAAFDAAHELGMFTVLWCYVRNDAFKKDGVDYMTATDLTSQAVHLGVTIKADIIKQKLPETNAPGFKSIGFAKTDDKVYNELSSDHPIDMTRYQVANCYMGRAGLINSGGPSGKNDLGQAVTTAVINKRAGGMGLISGRKAFQKPLKEGIEILNAIQDVYLCGDVTIA
jgi:class I fructose-bisphosphate aldolase